MVRILPKNFFDFVSILPRQKFGILCDKAVSTGDHQLKYSQRKFSTPTTLHMVLSECLASTPLVSVHRSYSALFLTFESSSPTPTAHTFVSNRVKTNTRSSGLDFIHIKEKLDTSVNPSPPPEPSDIFSSLTFSKWLVVGRFSFIVFSS